MKRLVGALVAGFMIATLQVAMSQPAQAVASCTIQTPARISITSPFRQWNHGITCSGDYRDYYASWDLYSSDGLEGILIWDEGTSQPEDLYDWETLGQYKAQPSLCFDVVEYNDCSQNTRYFSIKFGSARQTKAYRSGTKVDIPMKITRYSRSDGAMRAWSGGAVKVYANGAYVKTLTLSTGGTARFTTYTSVVKNYRFVLSDTSTTFGQDFTIKR